MAASNQITFVLNNVSDYESIVSEIGDSSTVYIIDAGSDALAQMADILSGYHDLNAVHIMSHGDSGVIDLGLIQITNDNVSDYTELLNQIGSSLSADGDILVYGCEVAAGESGKTLIASLAQATGADISASDDLTGAVDKGGDWVLEFSSGSVEADVLSSDSYDGLLAVPSDGLYTFINAVDQGDGSYITQDNFFVITGSDGYGTADPVKADEYGAYIDDNGVLGAGTSYIEIGVNGGGSFNLVSAVINEIDGNTADFTDVYVVGYANGVQVAESNHHSSVGVMEDVDYGLDFTNFNGVVIDSIRVYYSWDVGTPQTAFNVASITIANASTTPAAPADTALLTFETGDGTTSGLGTKTVTYDDTGSGVEFTVEATASQIVSSSTGGDADGRVDAEALYFGWDEKETSIKVSVESGKAFDLVSFYISNQNGTGNEDFTITTDKGGSYTFTYTDTGSITKQLVTIPTGDADFNGITWFIITSPAGGAYIELDNISVENITTAPTDTAPTLTATGASPTFTEGGSAVDLFSSVTADTQDSGQTFTGFTITVTNVTDSAEYLTIGGTDVALTNGNSVSVSGGTASVSISGGTATVTITGLSADNTSFGTLVDGITYKNTSENISAANRVVTLTQIIDDGSSNNSSSLSLASTVSVARDDLLTSGDIISSSQGFTKSIGGVTFNFDAPANAYVELIDETSFSGLYVYDYDVLSDSDPLNDSATFVKFYAEGYSFDLNGFEYYADNRCSQIEVRVTYGDGTTASQIIDTTGQSGVFDFTSFTISTNDVTMVELISEDYILYNNMDITDIKQSPWTINFDFESGTVPVSDDTGATVASTATQTKYGETIEIVSTGGDFIVADETATYGTDIGTGFSGDILSFDMMDGDSDSEYASTRIDVALQSGKYFTLSSLTIFDNYNVDHNGQDIKIVASNGTEYTVVIDYAGDDNGGVTIDLSGISGFENITSFYVYAGGMPMQLALDNIYLSNISSTPVTIYHVPTLSASGESTYFTTGTSTGVDLFETVTADTQDSGQTFTGFKITVTNVTDSEEYLTIGGTDVALTNGNSVSVSGGTASVSITGGTATVTITGLGADNTSFGTLIDGITYKNTTVSATDGDRVISVIQVTDDGATKSFADVSGVSATVSVVTPVISLATYDASTGTLVVTGTGMTPGAAIDASKLTFTGEDGNTYTLAGSYTVTASSSTSFTVSLDATDKLNVNGILNNNGGSSADLTTFNLAAASGWLSGADADTTGNGITVSNVSAPTITETSYNASTGVLTVTATNLVHLPGAANDIDASAFTFTGEGGATYTLTNTSDVEITSATSFTITLSSTDKDAVANLITANGPSSDGGTTYNISAADDWNGTTTGGNIADATSSVTVSGFTTNDAAVLDLNGADTGTDSTVSLADAGSGLVPDAVISDTENDSGDWDGGSITIQRVDSNGDADGNANDVYTFVSGGNFTVTGTIEQGSDSSGTLSSGGTQFATWSYTSADGKLVVSFDSDASTADVNDVLAHIGYENDTPYGDAVIEVAVNDGTATTTAEVTVTSTVIHVTQTDYDTDGDTADGMSLYEALAIARDGDTILIHDGVYRGQFNITKNITIDALNGENGNVVIESPDSADLQQVLPDQLTNNGKWRMPVINVDTDTTNGTVVIKNITVDGRDQAVVDEYNGNKDFIGIAIYTGVSKE